VKERLGLDAQRKIGTQDTRQHLAAGLDRSLGPAVLLRLERIHLHRHLGGRDQVLQEDEAPAAQLRAVAQVEIFGQRVVLPAAGVGNRRPAPDARGAVEVEEMPRPVAAAVLEDEVAVQEDRLDLRQQRVVLVDVPPPRLHHRHLRIGEELDGSLEEVVRRNEVGVEDRHVLAGGGMEPGF